jgi:hypothetical protein
MEITYGGAASFTLRGTRTVSIDAGTQDIALFTRRQKNASMKINGPGEYEVGGVLITTLDQGGTLLHVITLDDVTVAHISGDASKLSERDLEAVGRVDILLVRADDARAAGVAVTDLAPRVVIPFGAQSAAVVTTAGVKNPEPQPRFSWNGAGAPPKAVLLKEQTARRKAA